MRRLAVAWAAVLTFACAAPADAAAVAQPAPLTSADMWAIDLAGGSVAVGSYATTKDPSGNDIDTPGVYVIGPDGGVREVLHVDDPSGTAGLAFAADASQLVYYATKDRKGTTIGALPSERILGFGPIDGPYQRIEDCAGLGLDFETPAVDGPVAAWTGADCDASRILVRDGRPGAVAERTISAGGVADPLALAVGGHFVAWISDESRTAPLVKLHVYDLDKGGVAYTTPLRGSHSLALDGQGNAALASSIHGRPSHFGCEFRLLRTSVADPAGRYLKSRVCDPFVKAADGRVAVLQAAGRGHEELRVLDASNRVAARIARFPHTEYSYDFDGQRVAWTEQSCRYQTAYAVTASGPASKRPAPCPFTIGRAHLVTVGRERTVRVRVSCRAGCHGKLELGHRPAAEFAVPPHGSRDVTLVKNTSMPRGRRLLLDVTRLPEAFTQPPVRVVRTLR